MKHRKYFIILGIILISLIHSCTNQKNKHFEVNSLVPIVDFSSIKPLLEKNNDTTYVVNFWATWCAPCVKEIPYFERLNQEYKDQKVKVILVNLDFPSYYDTRVIPFIEEKKIQSDVLMLDDPDANRWINEVDPKWSGSIPATVIYKRDKREFFESELSFEELEESVKKIMLNQ